MFSPVGTKAKIITIAASVVFCLCAAAAGVALSLYRYATTPTGASDTSVVVWIKPGQRFSETVAQLEDAAMVKHRKRFRLIARLTGDDRRIQAGEYLLRRSMSPIGVLDTLVSGKSILYKVVIPEGSSLGQIAEIVEKAGLLSREAFLKHATETR